MNWLNLAVGYIGIQLLLFIIIVLLSWFIWDKRFKSRQQDDKVPPGFEKTGEVTIDPTTGKKLYVYYHPGSGERFYKEEK